MIVVSDPLQVSVRAIPLAARMRHAALLLDQPDTAAGSAGNDAGETVVCKTKCLWD
jgi:hypothetical protein